MYVNEKFLIIFSKLLKRINFIIIRKIKEAGCKHFKFLEFKNSNCFVKITHNCGHLCVIVKPDKVNEYINEFLKN